MMRGIVFFFGIFCFLLTAAVYCCLSWSNPDMTTRRLWIEFPWTMVGIVLGYVISGVTITIGGNIRK